MATVKEAWEQVGKDLSDVSKSINESGIGERIAQFGSDLGKSIVTTVKHGIKAVSDWADSIEDEAGKAAECAENAAEEAADVIYAEAPAECECENAVKDACETVEDAAEEVVKAAEDVVCEAAEAVENVACEAAEAVENAAEEAAEAAENTVEAAAEAVDND